MISIKKFIGDEAHEPLVRVLHTLLEGIAAHVLVAGPDDHGYFRRTLEQAGSCFSDVSLCSEYPTHANAIVAALEENRREAAAQLQQRSEELQSMFGMLTKTVESIAAHSEENIARLKAIEGQIVRATQI